MPQITCPFCGRPQELTAEQWAQYQGQPITCPGCQRAYTVGGGQAAPAAQAGYPPAAGAYAAPPGFQPAGYPQAAPGQQGYPPAYPQAYPPPPRRGMNPWLIVLIVGAVLAIPLAISILLPVLSRAREQANRAKCATNMRQIGLACMMYATETGHYPDRLDRLVNGPSAQALPPTVFVCPSTPDTPPSAGSPSQTAADLTAGGHLSYVYVGAGLDPNGYNSGAVLLYEPLKEHRDGSNFVFADGHIEFITKARAEPMIAALENGRNPPGGGQ